MTTWYFKLDAFTNPYPDDKGSTSTITFNGFVEEYSSDLGMSRSFNVHGALGRLRLHEDISGGDYAFAVGVDRALCPTTGTNLKVAIAKSDAYAPLCFDDYGYVGMLYNGSFTKVTSPIYPSGLKISDVTGTSLVQVVCVRHGANTEYYANGVLIGSILVSIDFDNTTLNDIFIGNLESNDGRLGIIDEIVIFDDYISAANVTLVYASFERYIAYEDDLSLEFYYSGNGISAGSLGGPITSAGVDPYSELNAVIPEILRPDNYQGKPVYKCLYLRNDKPVTIFEPKLTIVSDITGATPKINIGTKNSTAVKIEDKYDSSDKLSGYAWIDPEAVMITETMVPNSYVPIWIRRYVLNLNVPNAMIIENALIGNNVLFVTFQEASKFYENEFCLLHRQIDDVNYITEIVRIKEIDEYADKITLIALLTQDFSAGSIISKLDRSVLFVEYGA